MRPLHGLINEKFSLSFCDTLQSAILCNSLDKAIH